MINIGEYESSLPIKGFAKNGASVDLDDYPVLVMGSDGSKYITLLTDNTGAQVSVGAGADGEAAVGNPVRIAGIFETGGGSPVLSGETTNLALDAYGRAICVGQVANGSAVDTNAYPLLVAGWDGTNVRTIKTTTGGALLVSIGAGTKDGITYGTQVIQKGGGATTIASKAGATTITRIIASGSGLMKVSVWYGTTGSEVQRFVQFNSTANPNVAFEFPNGLDISGTESILVKCENLEAKPSPISDFSAYATIYDEVVV